VGLPVNGTSRVPGHLVWARLTICWDIHGVAGPVRAGWPAGNESQARCWRGRPGRPRQQRFRTSPGQNLDMVLMKVLPTLPIPVRPSKPLPAVRVTLRVAQLPVASQYVSGPA
jgi:hypothetical protein